jgi:hypothetical protein
MHWQNFPDINRKIDSYPWQFVRPIHCHQRLRENTLVRKIRACSSDNKLTQAVFNFQPDKLRFFFDHRIDHLPGMLEVNAMRQGALAVTHLIYGVPLDSIAVLEWLEIKFYNYGELDIQTSANSRILEIKRSGQKVTLTLEALMLQGQFPLVKVCGKLLMLSPPIAAKLRHKKMDLKNLRIG